MTSRLIALVSLSITLLACLALPAHAQHRPPNVMLIGSSSIFGPLGVELERHFAAAGLRASRISHRSTGFARPDFFDWQEQIAHLGDLSPLRGVIVAIGGNDTMALRLRRSESRDRGPASWVPWSDATRWTSIYTSRVRAFVDGLCAAGARRVVVLPPADGERTGWADRIHRVQDAQIAAVRGSPCATAIDTRVRTVRRGDTIDGVHLGARASRDLVARIGDRLLAELGVVVASL